MFVVVGSACGVLAVCAGSTSSVFNLYDAFETVGAVGAPGVFGLYCARDTVCVGTGVCLVCVGGVGSSVTQSIGSSGLCLYL